ncbi:MAG: MFS transporter [bacterium]|nr:MFS transporter [bacterium]
MSTSIPHATEQSGLKFIFRALRHRNYRLFFSGQGISLIGTWLTRVATGWLVYRLTDSAFLLGVVGFAGQIPTFLLSPFAGLLADRWNRRRLLVLTQILSMLQSFVLAGLALTHTITVWHIIILSLLQGIVNAVDTPARQAFVVELVERREDLPNAIALNSSMFNGARLIGPSLAGVLIAFASEGWCFLVDGFSYLAVIASLLAMSIAAKPGKPSKVQVWQELREGFVTAFGFLPIRSILILIAVAGFMGMPYIVLMPVFARDVLHGGPHTLGFLMGAAGLGALVGALFLASRRDVRGLGRIIAVTSSLFGLGIMAFALSHTTWLSVALMLVTGFAMMVQTASCNTILQTIVQEDMRGRVMSLFAVAMVGMAPFGSLFAGFLSSRIGPPHTLVISGCICILGALAFARQFLRMRGSQYGVSSL